MTVPLLRPVSLILLMLAATSGAVADSSTVQADSTQAIIAQLFEKARSQWTIATPAALDSLLFFVDSARRVVEGRSGMIDTIEAMALYFDVYVSVSRGDYSLAEREAQKAIEIWQSVWGPDCPQQASPMRFLADIYGTQYRYTEMEETFRRAITILTNAPQYDGFFRSGYLLGLIYNNWAEHLSRSGRLDSARILYTKALDYWTEERGSESPAVAAIRHNLGNLALRQGDYLTAEREMLRVLRIHEQTPRDKRMWATELEDAQMLLVHIWDRQNRRSEADSLLDQIMVSYRNMFPTNVLYLRALRNAASTEQMHGHWAEAAAYTEEALNFRKRNTSSDAGDYSRDLLLLAHCYDNLGEFQKGLQAFEKGISLRQSFIGGVFSYASENTKLLYMRMFPSIDHGFLHFAVTHKEKVEATDAALQMVLAGKAIVLDALSDERRQSMCSDDPDLRQLTDKYADVCDAIANVSMRGGGLGDVSSSAGTQSYYAIKDSLETELSRRCSRFRDVLRDSLLSTADVVRAMPGRSVLWEFVRYWPASESENSPHYLVFTLDAEGNSSVSDLGETELIDSLVMVVHQNVNEGIDVFAGADEKQLEEDLREVSSRLTALVFSPLEETAAGCEHIYISPDGQLSLLPFEILPLPDHGYAVEEYEFSYLSSGRDLLKSRSTSRGVASGAVVLAAPDYENAQPQVYADALVELDKSDAGRYRGPADRSECLSIPFNQLPVSSIEGNAISELLTARLADKVNYLTGSAASEDSLKRLLHPPRILHLATHGYFCTKARFSQLDDASESPLLYSGLALAGCNDLIRNPGGTDAASEDGILTALEVSGMNLQGTDLVVMSACQTGAGTVRESEGVYGLRRAFQLAGARSVIMSMFDVPDRTATELITRFYKSWLSGTSKAEAFRNAVLSILHDRRQQRGAAHPLFWGGFVLAGDPK